MCFQWHTFSRSAVDFDPFLLLSMEDVLCHCASFQPLGSNRGRESEFRLRPLAMYSTKCFHSPTFAVVPRAGIIIHDWAPEHVKRISQKFASHGFATKPGSGSSAHITWRSRAGPRP